jgi:hypothetical protein
MQPEPCPAETGPHCQTHPKATKARQPPPTPPPPPPRPQFRRDALEALPLSEGNARPTYSPGCFGWWTGGGKGYAISDGAKGRHPCGDGLLWRQGDQLEARAPGFRV